MLTKIADSWIDILLVTAVDPYMDDPTKPKSVVHLKHGSHIVSATADDAATAINEALAKWKERQECGNQ